MQERCDATHLKTFSFSIVNFMKYIIANWKSNKLLPEVLEWVEKAGPKLQVSEKRTLVVCPSLTALGEVSKSVMVGNYPIKVGAQNVSPFTAGSYTGEENAEQLKQFANYVIIGHSERRKNFFETDEQLSEKVKRAKESGLEVIFCVQDENTAIPEGVEIVAYEPVFAIGTGVPDTPQNANEVSGKINASHPQVVVLYGGSVTSENAKAFLEQDNISGLLIGKASLDPDEFVKIAELA